MNLFKSVILIFVVGMASIALLSETPGILAIPILGALAYFCFGHAMKPELEHLKKVREQHKK